MTTESSSVWLQCSIPQDHPRLRLFCFPHAGGSAAFFRDWGAELSEFEVHAVRYPGRAERIDEDPPTDLRRLADDAAQAIARLSDVPVALFGHSMGAAVVLEAARRLEERGIRVLHLFASGSRNAPLPDVEPGAFRDDREAVIDQLVRLGGTDAELVADPVFEELILPYVLSDGRMFHAYDMRQRPTLRCPITAIAGDQDEDSDRRPWEQLTLGEFSQEMVEGGHFYLVAEPPFALLRATLDPASGDSTRIPLEEGY